MAQLLKDEFLPLSTYNSLPNIRNVAHVPETYSEDLAHLQSLLDKHELSAKVSIKLVHIHFPLHEGEIMAFGDVNVAPYGPIPILRPVNPAECTSTFHGSHLPRRLIRAAPSMGIYDDHRTRHVPARVFRLRVLPCHRPARFAAQIRALAQIKRGRRRLDEFEYPEKRATFLVPDSISFPILEHSFNTTTEWPRECFKPTVMGVSYKHCYHCKHPKRSGTHPEFEKLEHEAASD